MELTIDSDVTEGYAEGWHLALTLSPSSGSAHLAWSPGGYGAGDAFEIRLGRDPLTEDQADEVQRRFETFPRFDAIAAAAAGWHYAHDRDVWIFGNGPWSRALDELEGQLWEILDV
ncbi:hypothetical protein [Streptomyces tsukubensis]|uniref:hypothetical protein n=1 Tax=Streptomyces tsukubensis TaxID=83656 RepID=UPI00344EEC27